MFWYRITWYVPLQKTNIIICNLISCIPFSVLLATICDPWFIPTSVQIVNSRRTPLLAKHLQSVICNNGMYCDKSYFFPILSWYLKTLYRKNKKLCIQVCHSNFRYPLKIWEFGIAFNCFLSCFILIWKKSIIIHVFIFMHIQRNLYEFVINFSWFKGHDPMPRAENTFDLANTDHRLV